MSELVGEEMVSPGVHHIQVRVEGREEAAAAAEADIEAKAAMPEPPAERTYDIPLGPEHWWVTFLD